ncbi:hypothetical protein [Halonatronum saccharophilum]|uniref:hypothetical protein n=1 Tax=Halonatronum saccharophilum TaxID=150060 RepID=UPI000489B9DB|nr:hypothetical protein [Halonatronum saccharophilum]
MYKNRVIVSLVLFFIIISISTSEAMYKGEVNAGEKSIAFNLQSEAGDKRAFTLESDFSLSSTLAFLSLYHHSNNKEFLNLDLKFNMISDSEFDLSFLAGYQIDINNIDNKKPRIGLIASQSLSRHLKVNGGATVLLKETDDILGFEFGFNYMLTRNWSLEAGHRRLAGAKDAEGLVVGFRNYF